LPSVGTNGPPGITAPRVMRGTSLVYQRSTPSPPRRNPRLPQRHRPGARQHFAVRRAVVSFALVMCPLLSCTACVTSGEHESCLPLRLAAQGPRAGFVTPGPYWSRPCRRHVRSMFARMSRYGPVASPGTLGATTLPEPATTPGTRGWRPEGSSLRTTAVALRQIAVGPGQGYEPGTVERGLSGMMATEPQPTAN
jgi:hypothetical protein